ncbi:hypothetical protein GIS00_09590 [Nakamurella sp. YIM 132087]|uniref:Uncharacterized protein n=1 Tax=Nakamurella alba TaxID=2665158 RepID=A0A7K1FJ97_9ACTN|nr:hypothetical protein [Nakamurella alba]MTD14197.1 hypothetical protein [Nakamurella alba]
MSRGFADFSRPTEGDPRWLETNWFSAFTADGTIRLHIWVGFRTNLGVAFTKIYAYSAGSTSVADMEFHDSRYQQPIGGARLADYRLASGLTVKGAPAPDHYRVVHRTRRFEAHLDYRAMMPPADLSVTTVARDVNGFMAFHRPADPTAAVPAGLSGRSGDEPMGHIDQTMWVTGHLLLDGVRHEVDGPANRDHSWSPRAEAGHDTGTFDMFHFGRELTVLTHTAEHPRDGAVESVVTNAYVLRGDQVRRVTGATMTYHRAGLRTERLTLEVDDETGEHHRIDGVSRAGLEFDGGQNVYQVFDLLDCTWNGRTGIGETLWHADVSTLNAAAAARRRAAAAV